MPKAKGVGAKTSTQATVSTAPVRASAWEIASFYSWVINAHTYWGVEGAEQSPGGHVPHFVHTLGMASLILNDVNLPWETRLVTALAAAAHGVFSDTYRTEADFLEIPFEDKRPLLVACLYVKELTFPTPAAFYADFGRITGEGGTWAPMLSLPHVLIRSADIVGRVPTLSVEAQRGKLAYMQQLYWTLWAMRPPNEQQSEVSLRLLNTIQRV